MVPQDFPDFANQPMGLLETATVATRRFPAMRNKFALDDPEAVARFAPYIIQYTSAKMWSSSRYMPPTRDLSESRRRLLHAWCPKAIAAG